MNDEIAVALIAGLSALAAAVVGLVGVLAPRTEPRVAKELLALDSILATFPAGEARESLEARRTRVALKYGAQREPLGVFAAAYLFIVGGLLVSVIALLVLGGDAGAWASLFQSLLIGVAFGGLLLALTGLVLVGFGAFFRFRDWWSGRGETQSADRSADASSESG